MLTKIAATEVNFANRASFLDDAASDFVKISCFSCTLTGENDGKNNSESNEGYCLCAGCHYWPFVFNPH